MLEDVAWLDAQFDALTDTIVLTSPSQWAEANRYLPDSVTSQPGPFSFDVAPYLREIIDGLDTRSPVREISMMKGAQIGATVGVLENAVGYCMSVVKSAPMMFLTATDDLAKMRMDDNIAKMLATSEGLADLISSADPTNKRKQGHTAKRMSWMGGGSLIPASAKSAAKMRSFSIRYMLEDEVDGFPMHVGAQGKEGDPCALAEKRTAGFSATRKVLRLSTPLDAATSRIAAAYERGDKRRYFVPCLKCDAMQELEFNGRTADGVVFGITYTLQDDGATLVPGSVRYVCRECGHAHINSNKGTMLRRGEWRPEAGHRPAHPTFRSYQISALYSPAGMFSWEDCVMQWFDAWDVAQNRPRDIEKLRAFYNTVLGVPFEDRGTKLTLATVSRHRRSAYKFGQVPNHYAREHAGGAVQMLIAAVDVHGHNLRVGVFGFTPGERVFLIDHVELNGDTDRADSPDTWAVLADWIDNRVYKSDDGRALPISVTLVDSGYRADVVYEFCSQWSRGVLPVKGVTAQRGRLVKEFFPFETKLGTLGSNITVDYYKDQMSAKLKQKWDGVGTMPVGQFNAPAEIADKYLRELTVEFKETVYDSRTNRRMGVQWKRPHTNARNELWDLLVYARAGLDMIARDICIETYELEAVNMPEFWEMCERDALYWKPTT